MSSSSSRDYELVEPLASPVLESMRAFGYTPETAIADLVDNSISARASTIAIEFHWRASAPWISVIDNGDGMSEMGLVDAMRLGSKSPLEHRDAGDLGRFGLGLKTASFSQSRELTVITRSRFGAGEAIVRRWDLDVIRETNQWQLQKTASGLLPESIAEHLGQHGTVVVWSKLDRLFGVESDASTEITRDQFLQVAEKVEAHLSLVFHRFLSRANPIQITLNGHAVTAWDPFLTNHPATWSQPAEFIPLAGETVTVRAHVLPHSSKLTATELRTAAGLGGWTESQGFYVYRSDRLLVGGSWLGVGGQKDEHTKLARISLDLPPNLDHLWQVDVRKGFIKPPHAVSNELRRVARFSKRKAQEVYRFRGKQLAGRNSQPFVVAWSQLSSRERTLRFRLNREHPFIQDAKLGGLVDATSVERLLRFVEETVPVTQIGIAMADAMEHSGVPYEDFSNDLVLSLRYLVLRRISRGDTAAEALNRLGATEPFSSYPEIVQAMREELQ
jgi:hypothetical protein